MPWPTNCLETIGLTWKRLRMREYDLNFGAIDPISGGLGVALGSAIQLLKGVKQIGTSFSSAFKGANSHPSATKRLGSSIRNGLGGARRASRAVIRVPIDTGVAITQGVHNSPRLWGGQVRRRHTWITDFGSGLKAGGNVGTHCFQWSLHVYPGIILLICTRSLFLACMMA